MQRQDRKAKWSLFPCERQAKKITVVSDDPREINKISQEQTVGALISTTSQEIARLNTKAQEEGLTTDDHRSIAILTKTLSDLRAQDKEIQREYSKLSEEELIQIMRESKSGVPLQS